MAREEGHLGEQPDTVLHAPRLRAQGQQLTDHQAHMIPVCPLQFTHWYPAQERLQQPAIQIPNSFEKPFLRSCIRLEEGLNKKPALLLRATLFSSSLIPYRSQSPISSHAYSMGLKIDCKVSDGSGGVKGGERGCMCGCVHVQQQGHVAAALPRLHEVRMAHSEGPLYLVQMMEATVTAASAH